MHGRLSQLSNLLRTTRVTRLEDLVGELEASPKTLKNDIEHLRSLGHEITYSRAKGWRYLSPPPELSLSSDALFALLVAQKTLACYRGTPFEAPLRETFDQFRGDDSPVYKCPWDLLMHAVSVKHTGISTTDLRLYKNLVSGIALQRELRMLYRGLKDPRARTRDVRPYHLCCINNSWYLIAYDYEANSIRTFALPRIGEVTLLESTFVRPDASLIEDQIKGGFGIMFEAPPQSVSISFSSDVALWIGERSWHESQKIESTPDGKVVLTMDVGVTPDLEQWIMSFGEHAQVIAPRQLVSTIRERLRRASRRYQPKYRE